MRLALMSMYLCYWSPPDCKLLGSKVVVQNQIPSFGKIWEFSQSSHPCKVHNTPPSRRVCNGDTFPHPIAAYSFLGKVHLLESFPINGIKILFLKFWNWTPILPFGNPQTKSNPSCHRTAYEILEPSYFSFNLLTQFLAH